MARQKLTKKERREKARKWFEAAQRPEVKLKRNAAIKAAWAKKSKAQRRTEMRKFIDAGQQARKTYKPSQLEECVQKVLDFYGVDYKQHVLLEGMRVDFWLPTFNLDLEVDGRVHSYEAWNMPAKDAARDAELKEAGYNVARVKYDAIETNSYLAVEAAIASVKPGFEFEAKTYGSI